MVEVTFVGVRQRIPMQGWKGVKEWAKERGCRRHARGSSQQLLHYCVCVCIFEPVHMFVWVCVSICGVCARPTAVLLCMCVLRLRCCAQQTGWRNNGCHLSAWEGSVMDCIHVEVVDWQHSKTKDISSTLTAQKNNQTSPPKKSPVCNNYSNGVLYVFHKTASKILTFKTKKVLEA